MASITCKAGGTKHTHVTVEAVKRHYLDPANTGVCGDLYMGSYLDADGFAESAVMECQGLRWITPRGSECEFGHEHTDAETRDREGWDYAEDAFDAAVIGRGGRDYAPMGPNTFIDPAEVDHILSTHPFGC